MNSIKTHIIVGLICFIIGLLLMYQCNNPEPEVIIKTVKSETIDTAYFSVIIPGDTVYVRTKGKTVYEPIVKDTFIVQNDTINNLEYLLADSITFPIKLTGVNLWVSPPFVFSADTVIDGNKYKLGFKYPELIQELEVDKKPDTLMTKEITKYITTVEPTAWYETAYFGAGFTLAVEIAVYLIAK